MWPSVPGLARNAYRMTTRDKRKGRQVHSAIMCVCVCVCVCVYVCVCVCACVCVEHERNHRREPRACSSTNWFRSSSTSLRRHSLTKRFSLLLTAPEPEPKSPVPMCALNSDHRRTCGRARARTQPLGARHSRAAPPVVRPVDARRRKMRAVPPERVLARLVARQRQRAMTCYRQYDTGTEGIRPGLTTVQV